MNLICVLVRFTHDDFHEFGGFRPMKDEAGGGKRNGTRSHEVNLKFSRTSYKGNSEPRVQSSGMAPCRLVYRHKIFGEACRFVLEGYPRSQSERSSIPEDRNLGHLLCDNLRCPNRERLTEFVAF